jgi:ubiquinone biosynthesis monooxygenase Coq6
VENHVLLNALESKVPKERVRYGSNVSDVLANGNKVDLLIGDNERITANLVIGCDGFNSLVRRKSTLQYFERKLNEKGIVGTVEVLRELELDLNEISYQRFMPDDGTVVALLPLTDNYSSFVISTSEQRAEKLLALSDEEFVQSVNEMLVVEQLQPQNAALKLVGNMLQPFAQAEFPPKPTAPQIMSVIPKSRAAFPLAFATTVPSLVGSPKGSTNNKIVIIGDSSHRIQPLAGQGLNLGIGDAIELAEQLEQSLARGQNIFSGNSETDEELVKSLFAFERQRQFKLIPMMAAVASMQSLFTSVPSSLLSQFNALSVVKNEIVKFANSR